jgi:hypothetical protein
MVYVCSTLSSRTLLGQFFSFYQNQVFIMTFFNKFALITSPQEQMTLSLMFLMNSPSYFPFYLLSYLQHDKLVKNYILILQVEGEVNY